MLVQARSDVAWGQIAAMPVIARWRTPIALLLTHTLQALWRAEAAIGVTASDHLIRIAQVQVAALCLEVGAVRAANLRAFINLQPQPFESLDHRLDRAWYSSCGISILDAQQKLPAEMARQQPAKERCAISTDMLEARGAGSKAGSRG